MMHAFEAKFPPLTNGTDGVVRIVGTRIPLETIVASFDSGSTVEEIVQQYPSLQMADVYAVISYVLENQHSVREYLAQRHAAVLALRGEVEESLPTVGLRERLLARQHRAASR